MSKNKWRKSRSIVTRKMRLVMPEADIAIKEIEQAQTREEARRLIGELTKEEGSSVLIL